MPEAKLQHYHIATNLVRALQVIYRTVQLHDHIFASLGYTKHKFG